MNFDIELTSTPITSHAGLVFIGEKLGDEKFARHMQTIGPVGEYKDDPYFPQALGTRRLPSPETLRQRIEAFPADAGKAFRGFTQRLLAAHPEHLSEQIQGKDRCVIHIDVTPMDNSGSNKEGVSCTYKKFDGFAPIFAYAGPHGFMLNNQLRAGKNHCNCEGTKAWFEQILRQAEAVAPEATPRLVVIDAGHDAAENLLLFEQTDDTDFVIKHNLRKQDPAEWLVAAQQQSEPEKLEPGARCWYGERIKTVSTEEQEADLRVVWRATERLTNPDGQLLTEPLVSIEAYWTSLDWDPEDIQAFYARRGTSEQFHSELKTDLDLERLPSGKIAANQHVLDCGMVAYNLLRLLGQQMLDSGLVPGRKAESRRLRLRTVLQNLIYMAGQWISHARRWCLRIFEGHGWAQAALSLARPPD